MHAPPRVRAALFLSSLTALGLLFVAAPAFAQDDAPGPKAVEPSPPGLEGKVPTVSLALERVGGIGYAKASSSEANTDASVSLVAFGVGGVTPNPFAVPRLGLDFILPSGITLGGALGFTRLSASVSERSSSQDLGSVFLYTLTPRIGYRIPLSDRVDFTPRAGLTFAGASYSPADNGASASVFALAIGADAPFAFRLTDSFNLLAGAALDYTVSATATTTSTSTTVTGSGATTSTRSNSTDVKGALFSMQAWLGVGGYL